MRDDSLYGVPRARVCHCQAAELEAQYIHLIALQKANGNALLRALAARLSVRTPEQVFTVRWL